ncbi:MAG: 2-oxo acid dehydrogenase subunit E2 [Bdellovibrionales bacterium]|nr:2-oxo acid dehydrogenase subunit E2 [Bdellovibrionales bacterium]
MPEIVEIKIPLDQQEGTESIIGSWLKQTGARVEKNEPILEISTDKVMVEIAAPEGGVLIEILKVEGDPVEPGDIVARIEVGGAAQQKLAVSSKVVSNNTVSKQAAQGDKEAKLSPSVRRLVEEHKIDISQVQATGRGGRISLEDIKNYLDNKSTAIPSVAAPKGEIASRIVPHDSMRRSIARHMVDSLLHTAPHVTSVFEADLSSIIAHREKQKAAFEKKGVKLTYTSYFISAVVKGIRAVPEVNSRWHENELEIFDDCNIGVGTAVGDKGLVVPVLKSAQTLTFEEIVEKLHELTSKAREEKLTPQEVRSGTFTISNHGVSGSLFAAPIIIHQPQSAILGIGKVEKRPKIEEKSGKDEIVIKPMAYVTLTLDHRVLDAATANKFLAVFVDAIEKW